MLWKDEANSRGFKKIQWKWSPRVYSATNSAGYICFSECARKPVEKDDMSSHFVASLHPVGFVSM